MNAQALKGHLDALLLATLEEGPGHGYVIMEALRTGSGGRIDHRHDLPCAASPGARRADPRPLVGRWRATSAHLRAHRRRPRHARQ